MGALNFITTTLDMRAKGMTMMRYAADGVGMVRHRHSWFARVRRAALGGHSVVIGPQSGHELFLFRSAPSMASSRAIRAAHRFCGSISSGSSDILRCTSRFLPAMGMCSQLLSVFFAQADLWI